MTLLLLFPKFGRPHDHLLLHLPHPIHLLPLDHQVVTTFINIFNTPHLIICLHENKHTLWQDYHPQECQENFFCSVERLVCLARTKLRRSYNINLTIIIHSSLLALVLSLSLGLTSPIIKVISVKTTKPSKTFHIWSHGNEKVSWKYLQSPES